MAMAQDVEIGRVGDVNLVRFKTPQGIDESYARQNIRSEQINNGRIIFINSENDRPIISNKGFDLSDVTLSATDPLFATIGATFTDYDDFYTTYGVLVLGKTKPSGEGVSDGVISSVGLVGTDLNFVGSDGGFNGTVDLSTLPGGSGSLESYKSASDYGFTPTATRAENVTAWESIRQAHIAGNVTNLVIPDGTYNIDGVLSIQGLNGLNIIATRNTVISTNADLPIFKTELNADGCVNTNFGQLKLESTLSAINNRLVNPGLIFVGGSPFTNNVLSGMEATAPNTAINFFFSANEGDHATSNNTFTYNYIHDIGRIGIEITNHTEGVFRFNNNDISHNTIDGVGLVTGNDGTFPIAISLSGQGLYNKVSFNTVSNASRDLSGTLVGIAIENVGASYTQIVSNSFGENVDHPFSLSNEFPMYGVNITGNTSSFAHTNKSVVENISGLRLSNNRILGGLNIRNSENITMDNDHWTSGNFGTLAITNSTNPDLDFVGVKGVKIRNSKIINTQASGIAIYQSGDDNESIEIIDSYLEHEGGRYSHQGGTSLEPTYVNTQDVRVGVSDEILNPYGSDALPNGGTTGQVLAKVSDVEGDIDWVDAATGGSSSPIILSPAQLAGRYRLDGNRLGIDYNNTAFDPQQMLDLRNGTAKLYLSSNQSNNLFWQFYKNGVAAAIDFATGLNVGGSPLTIYNDFPIVATAGKLKLQGVGGVEVTGDIELPTTTNGLILKSPDGTRYRVTVANGGTLTVSTL